jgi:heme A synthase
MKWLILIFVVVIGYAIYTGNMGGARDAAGNYNKIMRGGE